ncbi:MAG: hypothetical protein QME32_00220 [Endomicrobiia bacterium]|nr:hypothetical protein [Endomicrobiia bacterium]
MPKPRTETIIDREKLQALAQIQCTDAEMCAVLNISDYTLQAIQERDPSILEIIKKGRAEGRSSLRRKQFKAAMDGNITMLIWLGKQYLGQTDKQEFANSEAYDGRISKWLREGNSVTIQPPERGETLGDSVRH